MSYYQDGYDVGKEAALDGERDITGGSFFDLLSAISNDANQDDWEEGYRTGYEAGKEELETNSLLCKSSMSRLFSDGSFFMYLYKDNMAWSLLLY
jgi:hypothetical protein